MTTNPVVAKQTDESMKKQQKTSVDTANAQTNNRRTHILLEAGKLFSVKDYNGVSMRDIATAAGVPLSSLVYHFSTKENLYRSVFDHFHKIFEERCTLLRKVPDLHHPDALRQIVTAFVRPVQQAQCSEAGLVYCRLVMRAANTRNDELDIIREYFDPMAKEFIASLQKALPHKTKDQITWAYLFATGALVMNSADIELRMERLLDAAVSHENMENKFNYLINFICAGILNA